MTVSNDADSNAQANGSGQGAASPASKSQGEDDKAPGGDYVKKSQFVAALNDVSRKADAAMAENNELRRQLAAATAKPEQKPATRSELNQMVAAGSLTQEQADQIFENQIVDRVTRAAQATASTTVSVTERNRQLAAELKDYETLVPEAWEEGTPERAKAKKEFDRLVARGMQPDGLTELVALQAAFGDLDALHAAASAKGGSEETHAETGGNRPGKGSSTEDGEPKGLTSQQRKHYSRLIQGGTYKDWAEVKVELAAAAKPRARR